MPSLGEDLFNKYCRIDSPEESMCPSMPFHEFKVDKRSRGPVFGKYVHLKEEPVSTCEIHATFSP